MSACTQDARKAWARTMLNPDPGGNLFAPSYWASAGHVAGVNIVLRGAHTIVRQLAEVRWPETMGASPYALTYAVARAVVDGRDVSSLNILLTIEQPLREAFVTAATQALARPPGPAPSNLTNQWT